MDTRKDRGDFYPGGETGGSAPAPQQSDKVDRVNVGEVGESYTLKDVKNKVNQIVRAIAPATVCLALAVVRLLSYAATAPLEDIPNTAPVVTNEEDSVALATLGTATNSLLSRMSAGMSELRSDMNTASNKLARAISESIAAESNRVESTYAKRSEIPAAPDLAPYALKSELPQDYITENDITNFATRAWMRAQGYATEAGVGARIDAQNLAINAATNALWAAHLAERARLGAATNALWAAHLAERARLGAATNAIDRAWRSGTNEVMRAVREIEIVAADSNAVTRLVTPDGTTWQDATGCVWRVEDGLGGWTSTTSSVEFISWDLAQEEFDLWKIYFRVDGLNAEGYSDNPEGRTSYTLSVESGWEYSETHVGGDFPVTFVRPTIPGGATNLVTRVAYTNDLAATDLTPATNYTDQVAAEFEEGNRSVEWANNAGYANEADNAYMLYFGNGLIGASDLIAESTNAAIAVAARKQDALPYPTNAIPYAAISGAPSGGQDWREVTVWTEAEEPVHYVTNGMMHVIHGTTAAFTVQSAGWPNGAAMYVDWDYSATPIAQLPSNLRLVGYGTWPTNSFQSVWWRSGATIYVNILLEE